MSKRRKLSDPLVLEQRSFDQCIRESIEASFLDGVQMFIRNNGDWKSTTLTNPVFNRRHIFNRHTDPMEQSFTDLKIMPKAYDDSRLRRPEEGEESCVCGDRCECKVMAEEDPNIDSSLGFVAVVYSPDYDLCLCCLRKQALKKFYSLLLKNRTLIDTIQPFESVVDQPGEYTSCCCLHPTGSNNISGPFVIHQRSCYHYTNGELLQDRSQDFHHRQFHPYPP